MSEWLTFSEMRAQQRQNRATVWWRPPKQGEPLDPVLPAARYAQKFFPPVLPPRAFTIGRDEKFYAIGSCFARGLEGVLVNRKFNVLSRTDLFNQWEVSAAGTTPLGVTNKYNLGSIRNELRWAFGSETFPENAVVELDDGIASDPHMNPVFGPSPRQDVLDQRKVMTDLIAQISGADVVVMTLGLIEVWKDTETGLIANSTPDLRIFRRYPDRFKFGRLGYRENMEMLDDIYEILQRVCKPGFRLVITVSPVPLAATFTNRDVVEASTYSKSVLRVVAEDFVQDRENVDYFPSYEIVMNSPRQNAWIEDCRHVNGELANSIVGHFINHYIPDEKVQPGEKLVKEKYLS